MIKPIAIYLPQFHPIPENDEAWGEGFTEWSNVKKAEPLFEGHYQPHIPHDDVGYYDLRNPDVLIKQAAMAKEHGIYGFAYYHYWFNGKLLLETPMDNMLKTGNPDFPFCYIWANENWTKRWDGLDNEVIIKQEYSFQDDLEHIQYLCKNVFNDKRYITIDEKPVFIVYRTELFPDIKRTVQIWREEVKKYGFKDIYLVRVEHFVKNLDPKDIGFDSAMEFAPDGDCVEGHHYIENHVVIDYTTVVSNMLLKMKPYKYFHCIFPTWDNTPRRKQIGGTIYVNTDLDVFTFFLEHQLVSTLKKFDNHDERLVFINAWNEWGEGCHIEPDKKVGYQYLNICKQVLYNSLTLSPVISNYLNHVKEKYNNLEERYSNLLKENNKLKKICCDNDTKIKQLYFSKDYKLGQYLLKPFRWIKNILYPLQK